MDAKDRRVARFRTMRPAIRETHGGQEESSGRGRCYRSEQLPAAVRRSQRCASNAFDREADISLTAFDRRFGLSPAWPESIRCRVPNRGRACGDGNFSGHHAQRSPYGGRRRCELFFLLQSSARLFFRTRTRKRRPTRPPARFVPSLRRYLSVRVASLAGENSISRRQHIFVAACSPSANDKPDCRRPRRCNGNASHTPQKSGGKSSQAGQWSTDVPRECPRCCRLPRRKSRPSD